MEKSIKFLSKNQIFLYSAVIDYFIGKDTTQSNNYQLKKMKKTKNRDINTYHL